VTAEFLQLLSLIIIANGSPILIRWLLNDAFNLAVDLDQKLQDNRRIFGSSKTWRGISAAMLTTTVAALLYGYPAETGMLIATYAMLGDLFSSFIKRRMSMKPSSMAPFLDQVPESLFPALMLMDVFYLDTIVILELALSHILYKWGVRKKPY
jgi:CDP-2,3-bis-(O-geranylgeranyl)-sn-glycerol synthase